ncbi:Phosphate-binding protein PstS [archaeon HR06]|nr:Phosphate-binding protein PstS [archaeon HR06]
MNRRKFLTVGSIVTAASLIGYFTTSNLITQSRKKIETQITERWPDKLLGGGSTFVNPLMQRWAYEFKRQKGYFGVDYQSIGSGQGIAKLKDQAVDFAASDGPLRKEDWENLKNIRGGVIHIPITIGAVVLAFNLPIKELKLSQELVLKIFDGRIKRWNDKEIVNLNPELKDRNDDILVAYRADRSGTTFVWTDFLGQISKNEFPTDFSFKVPEREEDKRRFIGARGNEGVTEAIKSTENCIGYVELSYAEFNKLYHAHIQNKRGNFVKASLESISEAIQSVLEEVKLPEAYEDWSKVSLIRMEPPSEKAYPVVSFVYILTYREHSTEKALALKEFFSWVLKDGQKYASELKGYIPLPPRAIEFSLKAISYIRT